MFVAGVVTKKRFSSVLTLSKKKTNQHRTLYLDPQRSGFMVKPNIIIAIWLSKIVWTFRNTHLPGTYLFQMEDGER